MPARAPTRRTFKPRSPGLAESHHKDTPDRRLAQRAASGRRRWRCRPSDVAARRVTLAAPRATGWPAVPGRRGPAHPPRGRSPARPRAGRRLAGRGWTRRWSPPSRARGVGAPWRAPGRGGRGGARRASTSCSPTGHGVGQVAGLPAAGADRDPRRPRAARASAGPPRSTSPRPRRWPRTSSARSCGARASTSGSTTHDGDTAARSATGPATTREYVLTNPDMLHRSLLPGHAALGARSSARCATSSSTSATTTAASSAPTSPRCCAGCGGSARRYGAHPTFVLASATVAEPEVAARRLTGLDVAAVTEDASPRGRGRPRAVGAAVHRATPARTAPRSAARRPPRPPTCSPTWSPRASARWPSSGRGAAPRRSR